MSRQTQIAGWRPPTGRSFQLTISALIAALVLAVPSLIIAPKHQPEVLVLAQVLIAGLVLGIGRMGADLLGLRIIAASFALPLGWFLGGAVNNPMCTDLQGCYQLFAFGVILLALLAWPVLAFIAYPTNSLWNRSFKSLRLELPWRLLPKPRTTTQWMIAVTGGLVLLMSLYLLLGIPAY